MEEIRLEIRAKNYTKKDGSTFIGYKGFTKKGWYDLKFTKEVKELPTKSCIIFVPQEKLNINFNGKFPVIWVSEILRTEEYANNLNVSDYFD